MASKQTILVFTGGGLAAALNPTLHGVITAARKKGYRILGGINGWQSLVDKGRVIDLTNADIEPILDTGGTFLRSSRTNPFSVKNGVQQVKSSLITHSIDAVVAIGGNDTLGAAKRLVAEENIPVVAIPKTIDNDLSGTYWSPGYPSAAHKISAFMREIREDVAYSLERIYVVEALGMHTGWLAASGSFAEADVILVPEQKISLRDMVNKVAKQYKNNGNYALIVVAQDVQFDESLKFIKDDQYDQYGTRRQSFIALAVRDIISKELGVSTKMLYPGNFYQTGPAIAADKKYGILLGKNAVEMVEKRMYGYMSSLKRPDMSKTELVVTESHLDEVVGDDKLRKLDEGMFNFDELQVTQKYLDYMEPALGKFKKKDGPYHQLLKSIKEVS
ncbi:6-phosphofructokinase [Patescibacteria group bacterium]